VWAQEPPAEPPQEGKSRIHTVPFEPMFNHGGPVLTVTLNGKVKARFLLDTGTEGLGVTEDLVKRLGLKPQKRALARGTFDVVQFDRIQIGTIDAHGLCTVFQTGDPRTAQLAAGLKRAGLDGIMGADLLKQFALILDFEAQTCTFLDGGAGEEDLKRFGFDVVLPQALSTRLVVQNEGRFFVSLNVVRDGASGPGATSTQEMLVDTGAKWTNFRPDRLPEEFRGRLLRKGEINSSGANVASEFYRALVGAEAYPPVPLSVVVAPRSNSTFAGNNQTLGIDFLAHYRVLIDLKEQRMYLKPIPASPTGVVNPSLRECRGRLVRGLSFIPFEDGLPSQDGTAPRLRFRWRVNDVESGSAAEKAGVVRGDEILAIGSVTDLSELLPDEVGALLDKEGVTVRLKRAEGAGERTVTL